MDERDANIDIVFRNGLKDIEVLPPQGVWENIKPVIRKRDRSYFIFSAAALAALLISLSFLAYRWSMRLAPESAVSGAVFSLNSGSPLFAPGEINKQTRSDLGYASAKHTPAVSPNGSSFVASNQDANTEELPSALYSRPEVDLYGNNDKLDNKTIMRVINPVKEPVFEINTPREEYKPEISSTKPSEKWSIAAMASPTYYSRLVTGTDDLSKQMSSSEESMLSYSGGLALSYRINKRLSVQTGLYYSSIGQKVDGIISFGGFQPFGNAKGGHNFEVLTSSGTIYTNNSDLFLLSGSGNRVISSYNSDVFDPQKANLQYINNTLRQDFSYLELPVVLRYKVIDRTLGFNVIGGVSYNFLVSNDVYTTYNGSKYQVGSTQGLNPFTLSSSLGMGMEYNLSGNLSLNLEPTFRYYINPFSSGSGLRNHPYSFGIFSGISFKF